MKARASKSKSSKTSVSTAQTQLLIVGTGNMGGSLVRGLCASERADAFAISVFDTHHDKLAALNELPVSAVPKLSAHCGKMDVVILCVKPQDLEPVAAEIAGKLNSSALLISILAGTSIEDLAHALRFKGSIVRGMPNIPATVSCAATVLCANDVCSDAQRLRAEAIFQSVGDCYWAKESLLDAVTGLSGSGPAYVYMIIEALTDGGVKMGIPRVLASRLATQTVLGAALLVKTTGEHPAVLRDQVTTPGGTTINAIHELEAHGLRSMLISAVATATTRAGELRKKR